MVAAQEQVTEARRITSAQQTLHKATALLRSIATEGGYVYLYDTNDPARRTAERPATVTQITMQPPGTPAMGATFLQAYAATKDPVHLEAARAAATALARCQLASGGWHSTADFDPARPNVDGKLYGGEKYSHGQIIKHTIGTTFDDDTTQSAVRFLVEVADVTKDSTSPEDVIIRQARDKALDGMLRAQYPNGAWPQMYRGEARDPKNHPVKKAVIPPDYPRTWPDADYTGFYTLNDNCHSTCVKTMLFAHRITGRQDLLESARRGADFLLLAQLPEPQPAWAQQYNFAMEPAWARAHESPSVCSAESANVIEALTDFYLETGDEKYLAAAEPASAWLRRSMIGKNLWSRLYELGSNRPVYGDDRGQMIFDKKELHAKSATGYSWESKFKISQILARYEGVKKAGRKAALADPTMMEAAITPEAKAARKTLAELSAEVDKIIAAQDAQGRWITNERWRKGSKPEPSISTRTFIQNVGVLAAYLKRTNSQ